MTCNGVVLQGALGSLATFRHTLPQLAASLGFPRLYVFLGTIGANRQTVAAPVYAPHFSHLVRLILRRLLPLLGDPGQEDRLGSFRSSICRVLHYRHGRTGQSHAITRRPTLPETRLQRIRRIARRALGGKPLLVILLRLHDLAARATAAPDHDDHLPPHRLGQAGPYLDEDRQVRIGNIPRQ
jgi:hypothetical protein